MTIFLSILGCYARCVVKQQKISSKVKNKIRNLVQESKLIDFLPYGSIQKISKKLDKERGTVRGALQGKWVNVQIIEESIELIDLEIQRLTEFVEDFKKKYDEIK